MTAEREWKIWWEGEHKLVAEKRNNDLWWEEWEERKQTTSWLWLIKLCGGIKRAESNYHPNCYLLTKNETRNDPKETYDELMVACSGGSHW